MALRLFPRTAFARSALVVGLVIGLTQALALWFFVRYAYLPGISESARLTMLQAEVSIYPDTRDRLLADGVARASGIEPAEGPVPDSQDAPLFAGPVVERFRREMEDLMDESVEVRYEEGRTPVLWVTAPSLEEQWLRVPMNFFRHYDRYLLIGWGLTIPFFTVLGALLIGRGLNRPLKRLERRVAALGRDSEKALEEEASGPEEVAAVHRALVRMARDLRQARRDRALLLAGVSHDLRTPLTRLRLSAEFLQDPDLRDGIVADIEDMDAILDQFIAFIRDGEDEEPEYQDPNGLVEEVCGKHRELQVELKLRPVPRLMLKTLTFKRMLSNLLSNAERYGQPPVEIHSRMEHGEVVLVVRDHGPGVNEAEVEHLLEPFSRGDLARSLSGSGLGLAIVKRIVDMHHGRMRLGNHPGGGLRVEVRLPVTGRQVKPETLSGQVR